MASAVSGQGWPLLTTSLTVPGGLLQDYFNELCFYLTKDDVIILKNCELVEPLHPWVAEVCLPDT